MPDSITYQQPITTEIREIEQPVNNQAQTTARPFGYLPQQADTASFVPRSFIMGDSVCVLPDSQEILLDKAQQLIFSTEKDSIPTYIDPAEVYGLQSTLKARYTGTLQEIGQGINVSNPINSFWFDVITLSLLIYMLLVITCTRGLLNSLIDNLLSYRKTHKIFQINSQSSSFSRQLYFIPLVFIFSLFFLYALNYLDIASISSPLYTYAGITILLTILMLVKSFLLSAVGFVTKSTGFISELFYNRQISLIITGLLIFPWVLLSSIYLDPTVQRTFMHFGFFIFATYILFFFVRTYFIFKQARISHFLWILYLCILEIAPYLTLSIVFQ